MNWFYLTLIDVLGAATANIFRRVAMKDDKSDAIASTIVFQLIGTFIVAVIVLFRGFHLPPIKEYPLNFILQGVFWGSASYCIFKASRSIEASEVTILSTLSAIITIIVSILFLHQSFTLYRVIGTILIVSAVIYVSYHGNSMKLNQGVAYMLLYSLFSGIAIVNDAYMVRFADALSYLVVGWFTPALFLMIVQPKALLKINYFFNFNNASRIMLLTLFYCFGGVAFFIAMSIGGPIAQMSAITESVTIVTIILAAIFLKERDHLLKKLFSAIVVTIGIFLLR